MLDEQRHARDVRWIKGLAYLIFLMFAMTTDAVGSIIPTLIAEFHLSMKAASAFHYVPMTAIALGALTLGFLADRAGRKLMIVSGLALYGGSSLLFAFGHSFGVFVALLAFAGAGVSLFKVGALALVGDISRSTTEHTALMNRLEGFFGIGAIIGPALVAVLLSRGLPWVYLYVIAAIICSLLTIVALTVRYPRAQAPIEGPVTLREVWRVMRNPYALGFALLMVLYVAVEAGVYVWMPTYLQGYTGPHAWLSAYALGIFFLLRAAGRFLGGWLLQRYSWTAVLLALSLAIVSCFAASIYAGPRIGVYLMPLTGLFMSVMYPTLNSKGISCFEKAEHGTVAGVLLFFTACAAAAAPLAMAAVSDAFGGSKYGFVLSTILAALLFAGLLANRILDPAGKRLSELDRVYQAARVGD